MAGGLSLEFVHACDGFVLSATSIPGTYEDIVRLVVPELQRRSGM